MEEPQKNDGAAPEPLEQTIPRLPWGISLNDSLTFFQKLPGGGMLLVFTPAAATPQGLFPMPPAVSVVFGDEGWRRFQEEVAAGEKKPVVPTATILPGRLL